MVGFLARVKFFTTPFRTALGTHCHTIHFQLGQHSPLRPHMHSWCSTVQINRFQIVSRTRPTHSQLGASRIKTSRNCVGLSSSNSIGLLSSLRCSWQKLHSNRSHGEVPSAARLPARTAHSSAPRHGCDSNEVFANCSGD